MITQGDFSWGLVDSQGSNTSEQDPDIFDPKGGYYKFPNGLIMQWGNTTASRRVDGSEKTLFPIPFPHSVLSMAIMEYRGGGRISGDFYYVTSFDRNGFYNALDSGESRYYIALGY